MNSPIEIKRFIDIAWRRKWWFVFSTLLAAAASLVVVAMMPKVYRATTTILVTRQRIPEDIVRSTVTLRIDERMRTLELQILSRSYLEQVARKFDLVRADAGEAEIDEACARLRAHIMPELDTRDFSWFRISADDGDPNRAAGIANQLASLFIDQNSRMRAAQAGGTLEATGNWEQGYRLDLAKRDEEISRFKERNIHELPEQQPANLQFLSNAESRDMQLTGEIQLRNDRLATLRTEQQTRRPIEVPAGADETRLAALRRELAEMLVSYTDENPLVKRKREQIAEAVRSQLRALPGTPANSATAVSLDPVSGEIMRVEHEIEMLQRDRARERSQIETYRARIDSAPRLQPKMLELTRDYDEMKHQLDLAVVQNEQAQHSQDLEDSKKGEQFQIQDRAYPPTEPYKPNLLAYVLAGIGLGLVIGVGATAAREFVDQTVRGEDQFAVLFPDLPVYAVIPNLNLDRRIH